MSDVTFVQGTTLPPVVGALKKADGSAFPLAGVTAVHFQMRKENDKRFTVNGEASITDAPGGKVQYDWAANDLVVPGEYVAWWELTLAAGGTQVTFPANTLTVQRI